MTAPESRTPQRNAVLEQLNDKFDVIRKCQPLALGIHKEILVRAPEIDAPGLRVAMRLHTTSTRYLKELQNSAGRFDLDGNAAGEVTQEQRELAAETLRERFRKIAERRKLEQKAQAEARREQESLQQRQQKLEDLASRFNRR
jgi:ProP effector